VFAAAHGAFYDLPDLIGNSQAIVVVSVESSPKVPRGDSYSSRAPQKIRVLYTLKGSFESQQQLEVALDSAVLFPASTYLAVNDYVVYERYVLFLEVDRLSPGGYGVVNAEGGAFWIPPDTDLSALKPGDVRGNLESLLNSVSSYSKSRDRELHERLQRYFSSEP
jgi:hypothetical protein